MLTRAEIYSLFYSGDVVVKLAAARDLYASYGQVLVQRLDIMSQLAAMQVSERALQARMGSMGMGGYLQPMCEQAGRWLLQPLYGGRE